jgi:hypothetical protein
MVGASYDHHSWSGLGRDERVNGRLILLILGKNLGLVLTWLPAGT